MKLGDWNEKSFLKQVVSNYARTAATDQFDDCVIIDLEEVCGIEGLPYFVYSIDHPSFVRRGMDPENDHLFYGRWVAAIVCGDVLAMGAQPRGFALDLAAPLDMDVDAIKWILIGIRDVLDKYETTYEGGNIDVNPLETVGYAWGVVDKDLIIRRSGARVGNYVTVTGVLGFGWADWTLRKLGKFDDLSSKTQRAFRDYKLKPYAPYKAIIESVQTGGITSGMDLSDGPVEFFYTILERSGHGVFLDEASFPITSEMEETASILGIRPALRPKSRKYSKNIILKYIVLDK
jgi:thiamine-monophosphate kinase